MATVVSPQGSLMLQDASKCSPKDLMCFSLAMLTICRDLKSQSPAPFYGMHSLIKEKTNNIADDETANRSS